MRNELHFALPADSVMRLAMRYINDVLPGTAISGAGAGPNS